MSKGYGICRLAIMPVRKSPGDKAEMVNQLLFGEHYEILEISGDSKWMHIRNYYDDYTGWVDAIQHKPIDEEYYQQLCGVDFKICTDVVSSILYKKQMVNIVCGSILPLSASELFSEYDEQFAYNGNSKSMGRKLNYEQLREIAKKYRNAPYLWGGKSPFGIDCSGFIQQVYKIGGYNLKRDAYQQFSQGKKIDFAEALPGDLAFFKNEDGRITHVGMLWDEGQIMHASGKVKIDKLTEKGIFSDELNKLTHTIAGCSRVMIKT